MLIKLYWRMLWQQHWRALSGISLAVITALAGISLLAVSGWFISATAIAGLSAASAHSFNYFAPGAIVRGLSITRTVGRYGERLTTHDATLRVISQLRAQIFQQIAQRNHTTKPLHHQQVSSQLLQDIEHAERLYLQALVPMTVTVVASLLYLTCISLVLPTLLPWLALPLLVALMLVPLLHARHSGPTQDRLNQLRTEHWQQSSSLFQNLRTLILFQRLQPLSSSLESLAAQSDQSEGLSLKYQHRLALLSQLSLVSLTGLVLWQGLIAHEQQLLTTPNLFMLVLLTLGCQEVFSQNAGALGELLIGQQALKRLETYCPEPSRETARNDTMEERKDTRRFYPQETPALELHTLTYCYPQQQGAPLSYPELNLTIGWHWLTATSGGGKSTLLRLIAGQLTGPTNTLKIYSPAHADNSIGLMPQQVGILRASLRDNLCLHNNYSDAQLWQALALVELDTWVKALPEGLDTWLGDGERMPSGGEIKRLGLARIILQDRPVILLDEPTAGIDAERSRRILKRLRQRWSDRLVIISSHERSLMRPEEQEIRW